MTDAQYIAWLKDSSAIRCVLVEVNVKTGGAETTRYLSNKGYVTSPTDTPANTQYDPCIVGGVKFTESLSLDGTASLSFGDIETNNTDGSHDGWLDDVWNNRAINVFIGDVRWVRSDFRQIFSGIVANIDTKARNRINFKISDKLQRLNTPITEHKLGGTTANADKLVPLVFGECHNIEPLLTDPTVNEYQVHDGAVERIIEVRDEGVPVAFTPFLATGKFRLAKQPAGQVTCSVQGLQVTNKNLLLFTNDFSNAYWTKANSSGTIPVVTADYAPAPDGTITADRVILTPPGDAEWTLVRRTNVGLSLAAGQQVGQSVFLKATDSTQVGKMVSVYMYNTNATAYLTIKNVVLTGDWQRVEIAQVFPAASTAQEFSIGKARSGVGGPTNAQMATDFLVWGAQLESGNVTEYTPNGSASTATVYVNTVARLIRWIATNYGNATTRFLDNECDISTFSYLDATSPQPVGLYLNDRANVIDVLNQLAASIGGRVLVNRSGLLSMVKLALPVEKVADPSLTDTTPWTMVQVAPGTATIAPGLVTLISTAGEQAYFAASGAICTIGKWYELTFNVVSYTGTAGIHFSSNNATAIPAGSKGIVRMVMQADNKYPGIKRLNACNIVFSTFSVKELPGPPGTVATATDIVQKSIAISQLPAVSAAVQIGYCKNWTVQEGGAITPGIPVDDAAMYADQWLTVTRTDTQCASDYKTFTDPVMQETLLLTGGDAANEALRRLAMYNVQRKVYKYDGMPWLMLEQLGNSQTLTNSRFGLGAGKTGQIISCATDWLHAHITIEVMI